MHTLVAQQLMLAMGHELVRLAPAATMAFLAKAEKVPGSKGLVNTSFYFIRDPEPKSIRTAE
jgi:hypothetical protein